MIGDVLGFGMVMLAIGTIIQRRPLRGVLMRLGLSVLAVATYTVYTAPDVALAEAMVGALLMTYVYVLLLRTPGTVKVGYIPTRILFEEHPYGFDGLEYELVKLFCASHGLKADFVRFDDPEDLEMALKEGYVDIACGPFTAEEGILETLIFRTRDGTLKDFLSIEPGEGLEAIRHAHYTVPTNLGEFEEFVKELRESGRLEELVRKFAGGWE